MRDFRRRMLLRSGGGLPPGPRGAADRCRLYRRPCPGPQLRTGRTAPHRPRRDGGGLVDPARSATRNCLRCSGGSTIRSSRRSPPRLRSTGPRSTTSSTSKIMATPPAQPPSAKRARERGRAAHNRRASPRLCPSRAPAKNSSTDAPVRRIAGTFLTAMPSCSHSRIDLPEARPTATRTPQVSHRMDAAVLGHDVGDS